VAGPAWRQRHTARVDKVAFESQSVMPEGEIAVGLNHAIKQRNT
jgi:hypothetical protein